MATPRSRSGKGVDARAATLSYYRSKAKAGLPGARGVSGGAGVPREYDGALRRHRGGARRVAQSRHGLRRRCGVVRRRRGACYKAAVDAVRLSCPRGLNDEYVLGHVGILGTLCADGAPDVAASVRAVCA